MSEPQRNVSQPSDDDPEPELAFLGGVDPRAALGEEELDSLFEGVRRDVDKSGARRLSRLADQPTPRRRLFAFLCFTLIVLGTLTLGPRPDLDTFPPAALAAILGSFGVLLVLSVVVAFRPIYLPAVSTSTKVGLCVAAVGVALAAALLPGLHEHVDARPADTLAPWRHALPCLSYGLLAGLPAYALLRLLDRGAPFGRVLSAVAAGLGANMVLELHCPVGGPAHLALGHAMVVVAFVLGAAVVEWVVVKRRSLPAG